MSVLMYQEYARFRDLRPPQTDTNLFSYHLKVLMRCTYVEKTLSGYTLTQNGLRYVDRTTGHTMSIRSQPKIISMLLVQNSEGDILLHKRNKQPYINTWTLPYGKIHIDDESIESAAHREAYEKLGHKNQVLQHAGDVYIRIVTGDKQLSVTLAHIFRFNSDDIAVSDGLMWVRPHKLASYRLAPAVQAIVARSFIGGNHFFEEFTEIFYSE